MGEDANTKLIRKQTCRILIVGAHLGRVGKVITLLREDPQAWFNLQNVNFTDGGLPQHVLNDIAEANICVEYLPCVAKFDSYHDNNGNEVRYLSRVDCFGEDLQPIGLLNFFDETEQNVVRDSNYFPGIAGVAIGCGLEGEESTASLRQFFESMTSSKIPELRTQQPGPSYESMEQEVAVYKALSVQEKGEVTRQQTLGPGKMVKFSRDLAFDVVYNTMAELCETSHKIAKEGQSPKNITDDNTVESLAQTVGIEKHIVSLSTPHFRCRVCRTPLFGFEDLEDPPHQPSQHSFSHRKLHHGATTISHQSCQSYFLQNTMDWMTGCDGRFNCPTCDAKLGSISWSGAQCSCGTWVVPAIQIPKSKADAVCPNSSPLPPGAVVHEIVQLDNTPAIVDESDCEL